MSRPQLTAGVPSPPYSPPRIVRIARRLLKQAPNFPRREFRKRVLRKAYNRGCASHARDLPEEVPDRRVLDEGRVLRKQVLEANQDKHKRSAYRVLMLRPGSITAEIWFSGLQSCMLHAGIECRVLPPNSSQAHINDCLDEFQPNIFIATEWVGTLQLLDLDKLLDYKRHKGCLRLFVPVWHSGMPGGFSSPREDKWRWNMRRSGMTADAYFSIFEPEFYERSTLDRHGPHIDYVTVPQACNPFSDKPLPERKSYDYFMATSLTDERLDVTYRYLRPIMNRYRGLWAGPRWGFGQYKISPDEMPTHYSRTRVAFSPLAGFVPLHAAELTHRVYAAAGCGTFQLTTPTAVTNRYFDDDELIQARTPEEYGRLFDYYIDRPDERNAVALRGLRRAYRDHTCFNRVDQLVKHWDEWRNQGLF